ncbi:hypothetical protein MVLG_03540 [Microbotryum lychnidis-dioicae p1A1 Lamole]|uniref:Uridylate kinase n=1 Tax=Microbotryum lychnidis-dioicae (strain p1A1 Lamole / MvSl-1064) TaxID=683840 RepID=U5H8I1_USTV1|nr:hypothetical protein MVLG_03540 [Microbotryum lychnidis-dioicae p1A1 Lamole]|eukprot:KDE06123.1 hypothetical protein MVLG_03540 [Microbotryum lychnidis-dioicae p1A1 Lamole]
MAPLFKRLKSLIIGTSAPSNQKTEAPPLSSAWTATSSVALAHPHHPAASATAFSPTADAAAGPSDTGPASPFSSARTNKTTTLIDSVIPITVTPPTPGTVDPDYLPFADTKTAPPPPPPPPPPPAAPATMAPVDSSSSSEKPKFNPKEVTVIFVLGGPGAGKGTQCARLVDDYRFVHLSAGDLLRAEQQRPDSKVGAMIKEYITEGKIVPMEVTIQLLSNAMSDAMAKDPDNKRFLVDGFPRKMDQAIKFDESVCPSSLVLFLVCPEEILQERLLERGKTSGRDDDNAESIKKRFKTFIDTSMPVVDYYREKGKVVEIESSKTIDQVYASIVKGVEPVLNQY